MNNSYEISLRQDEADDDKLGELVIDILSELSDLGIDNASLPNNITPPKGAKGDPISIGTIMLVAIPTALPSLIAFFQSWVLRRQGRTVKLKIPAGVEVEFTTDKQLTQEEILELTKRLIELHKSQRK